MGERWLKRIAIRNPHGRLVAYAVLVSRKRGVEEWRIQRGRGELQVKRFSSRKAVRRAVLGE